VGTWSLQTRTVKKKRRRASRKKKTKAKRKKKSQHLPLALKRKRKRKLLRKRLHVKRQVVHCDRVLASCSKTKTAKSIRA